MKNIERLLEKLKTFDPRVIYAILAVAVLLLFAVDYFLVMRFQISGVVTQAEKNKEFKQGIEQLMNDKQHVEQFRKGLVEMKAKAADLERMVYVRDDIPSALKKISTFAQEYDVKIDQLTPQKQGEEQLVKDAQGTYKSVAIFVIARAGYHEFGRFINRMESERVFLRLDDLDMRADPLTPQKHIIKMILRIVVLDK